MKQFVSSLLMALSLGASALASEFAVEAGFRSQSGDSPTGYTTSSQTAFQLGGSGNFEVSGPLMLRTGMFYTQRNLNYTSSSSFIERKTKLNYFDIPVGLLYKFDYGGVYAGTALALNLDNSCTASSGSCTITNVKSLVTPIQIGASFKFAPQLGFNAFFETIPGEVAQDQSGYKAVGVNLVMFWD